MADLLEAALAATDRARGEVAGVETVEEEEEEEEPILKYNRFTNELVKRLGPQSSDEDGTSQGTVELISCIAVHSKVFKHTA